MGCMPVQGQGAIVYGGGGGGGGGVLICILPRYNILMHPNFLVCTRGKNKWVLCLFMPLGLHSTSFHLA